MTIRYPKRGMVEVDLRSPKSKYTFNIGITCHCIKSLFKDTTCKMMEPRLLDDSDRGFSEWKIKSLQFWGEDPYGKWTVIIKDEVNFLKISYIFQYTVKITFVK